jgi:peptidoglycan/xylan/chitin deacetylase (PgdA/CDA1 family)
VFNEKTPYHPDDLTAKEFDRQISYLNKYFNILSLEQAITLLRQKKLPAKALVITFDDGYNDNYTIAAPILEKHNCTATFFIATEGVEQGYLWNDIVEQAIRNTKIQTISKDIIGNTISLHTESDKIKAFNQLVGLLKFYSSKERNIKVHNLTKELQVDTFTQTMMCDEEIKNLHDKGFTIGAHTHGHTILSTETDEKSHEELSTNRNYLEKIIQAPIDFLAYPNGLYGRDFTQVHCNMTNTLGFKAAFSTNDGGSLSTTDLHQIPRFMPYRKQLPLFALSIAKIAGEHV